MTPTASRLRDLTVWSDGHDGTYVLACDANAGVGMREGDFLRRPPGDAGYSAAKVALMEVLATGADPLVVANTLCHPLDEYGEQVVAGVRRAMAESGCGDAVLTGSDETNMQTTQTGLGVTVIGYVPTAALKAGQSRAGDVVLCVGVPRDGLAFPYTEGDAETAGPGDLLAVRGLDGVHEVLPVGSRGVAYEVRQLAETAGLALQPEPTELDLHRSAGASTCFLVSCPPSVVATVCDTTRLPVSRVATVRPPEGADQPS